MTRSLAFAKYVRGNGVVLILCDCFNLLVCLFVLRCDCKFAVCWLLCCLMLILKWWGCLFWSPFRVFFKPVEFLFLLWTSKHSMHLHLIWGLSKVNIIILWTIHQSRKFRNKLDVWACFWMIIKSFEIVEVKLLANWVCFCVRLLARLFLAIIWDFASCLGILNRQNSCSALINNFICKDI